MRSVTAGYGKFSYAVLENFSYNNYYMFKTIYIHQTLKNYVLRQKCEDEKLSQSIFLNSALFFDLMVLAFCDFDLLSFGLPYSAHGLLVVFHLIMSIVVRLLIYAHMNSSILHVLL